MAIDREPDWVPEACTLPTVEQPVHVAEFDNFLAEVRRSTRPQPTRLDLMVPRDVEATGLDLAARESGCCSFFTFTFEPAGTNVVMQISVPSDHVEVLDALEARAAAAAGGNRS